MEAIRLSNSLFPTHSAKDAEWMGRGALLVGSADVAAGGVDGLATEPAGVVGGEEGRDTGDVVGLADAAERGCGCSVFFKVAADETGVLRTFGFNQARIEGVNANLL